MTPREKLHLLVDELSDGEAQAALARLIRDRTAPRGRKRAWLELEHATEEPPPRCRPDA